MTITVELSDAQLERLRELAHSLGVDPTQLAQAAVVDLLHRSETDFKAAADYVLRKNRELYRRLG